MVSLSLLITACLAPVLGLLADQLHAKKKLLAWSILFGSVSSGALFFVPRGSWVMAATLGGLAGIGFGLSLVFYESLLPSVAKREEYDRVSAAGYALGYVGGGLLLLINTAWILWPERFGFPGADTAVRVAFLSVAGWWVVFSMPLFFMVPEPREGPRAGGGIMDALKALIETLRSLREHRDLFMFLLAFLCYQDGVGTSIKMATIFGAEIGIGLNHLILALLLTQFIAFPSALLFGQLGHRLGPRRGIQLALWVYIGVTILGYTLQHHWQFYLLASIVGTVQGGIQALSRSMFARMVPAGREGEFFGFYSVSAKFAAFFGPLLFAGVAFFTGTSRLGVLSIASFFLAGLWLLSKVDLERGTQQAHK
jgi:UMF1 family MFS transporter